MGTFTKSDHVSFSKNKMMSRKMLRTSFQMMLRNQKRHLLTYNSLGVDDFLKTRKEIQAKEVNFPLSQYQQNFQKNGSDCLSLEDVTKVLDASETEKDLNILAEILCSLCEKSRLDFIPKIMPLFLFLCIYKEDWKNAKKVFEAVHKCEPIGNGDLRQKYYYLLYQAQDHDEIIKRFSECSEEASDQEKCLYLGALYKIGTPKAYALIKNDKVTTSSLYNMARYIYAIFAIEQRDFREVYHILRRRMGRHEFMADLWFLRFYSTFKQGRTEDCVAFLENWVDASHRYKMTVPFPYDVMVELTEEVKNLKNPQKYDNIWDSYVKLCEDLEEKADLVEASVFEIVTRPNQALNLSKNIEGSSKLFHGRTDSKRNKGAFTKNKEMLQDRRK